MSKYWGDIVEKLIPYIREEVKKGTRLNQIMRHTLGLFHGQTGASYWKKYLSENMCVRDADIKKIDHIMDKIKYDNNFVAHINVNWLSPVKIRQTILGGSKKMILYNDLEPSDKIKVFNKGVDVIKNENSPSNLVEYKVGDTFLPNLKNTEALKTAVLEFKKMIHNKKYRSRSTGQNGMDVVKILEAADKSMANNGRPVKV